jgi:hypothetical protein
MEAISKSIFHTVTVNEKNINSLDKYDKKIKYMTVEKVFIEEYPPNITSLLFLNVNKIKFPLPPKLSDLALKHCNIDELDLSHLSLKNLEIKNSNLEKLNFLPNSITNLTIKKCNLSSIPNLPSELLILDLSDNKLTELPDLPKTIRRLKLNNNQLKKMPDNIICCDNLTIYNVESNPITYTDAQLLFLYKYSVKNYYYDDENVMSHATNETWVKSVKNLLRDKISPDIKNKIEFKESWVKNILSEHAPELKVKNIKWCRNVKIKALNTNIETIWSHIWNRILSSPFKNELILRFVEEITDANDVCATGYITRLVNVLAGFYDDINVSLTQSQHLGAIIENERQKVLKIIPNQHEKEFIDLWKKNVITRFNELHVELETLNTWIQPICDLYQDADYCEMIESEGDLDDYSSNSNSDYYSNSDSN